MVQGIWYYYPMRTVFVAMSGGLDSSFSAYLLKKQGYNVVGITFALLPETAASARNPKACCSLESINRARKVADSLSIAHYVINLRPIRGACKSRGFVAEYRSGRTPNPCILCNQYIKFSAFVKKALALGADSQPPVTTRLLRNRRRAGFSRREGQDKGSVIFPLPIERYRLPSLLSPIPPQ